MSTKRNVTRRGFLAGSAAAVSILAGKEGQACGDAESKHAREKLKACKKLQVGLQLFSVRDDCAKDLDSTVAAVAKMGYKGVEFAGYYGRSAKELRALLEQNGLVCCGTHTNIKTLLGDQLEATIEFNKTIGNPYLVVPMLPEKYRNSNQAWLDTAKLFNEVSAKVKEHGMQVGYHNHSMEFKPIEGKVPWDTFMQNTDKDVIMQIDTANASSAGVDPLPYLYRYPGRSVTVHAKAFSKEKKKVVIGEDDIPWKAFFALCKAVGGTKWVIVEQGAYPYPALECAEKCLSNLKKMKLV